MKTTGLIMMPLRVLFAFLPLLTFAGTACGQDKDETLQPPPAHLAVDGNTSDWGDSLRYYNSEKHINYAIANTSDTLYMAIRFGNRMDQIKILRSGLTFSIDPRGKKKEAFSITFPLNVQGGGDFSPMRDTIGGPPTARDREALMEERLTTLRGIRVNGFKDIDEDMITTSNTYGIRTAVNYDDNGRLVCEAAIPLKYFHSNNDGKNQWAFNFKVNGIQHKAQNGNEDKEADGEHGGRIGGGGMRGMGGGMRGMGGGRHGGAGGYGHENEGGGNGGEMAKSEDFWTKFYLTK